MTVPLRGYIYILTECTCYFLPVSQYIHFKIVIIAVFRRPDFPPLSDRKDLARGPLSRETWHHVVIGRNGDTGYWYLYIDGWLADFLDVCYISFYNLFFPFSSTILQYGDYLRPPASMEDSLLKVGMCPTEFTSSVSVILKELRIFFSTKSFTVGFYGPPYAVHLFH